MNWNLRNLDHFAPEIVQTYDLERRKENDQFTETYQKSSATGAVLTYIVCHLCVLRYWIFHIIREPP